MQIIIYILTYFVDNKQQTMKGQLYKKKQPEGWYVAYDIDGFTKAELPLHPDDIKQINADAQVFDNIEARIAAYPDVEFDWCVIVDHDSGKGIEYAKLLNN